MGVSATEEGGHFATLHGARTSKKWQMAIPELLFHLAYSELRLPLRCAVRIVDFGNREFWNCVGLDGRTGVAVAAPSPRKGVVGELKR
jgi:hypothetical protein